MANIDLVIKIPEECYKQITKHIFSIAYDAIKTKEEKKQVEEKFNIVLAIKYGTPLPKGHGRLIDADALKFYEIDEIGGEYNPYLGCSKEQIDDAPTIIEADKESKE